MSESYLQLRRIAFADPVGREAALEFQAGVNVICGASDTGKSFVTESIDFMLGGKDLRNIPERTDFTRVALELFAGNGERWRLGRAASGGAFTLRTLTSAGPNPVTTLKQQHGHDRTDNLSGFLLDKIGLLGKRILKSKKSGKTQSLSFRNLARLIVVQEGEIQQTISPFWGGHFTQQTPDLATVKLLLTGVDDSAVVSDSPARQVSGQIAVIDDILAELVAEVAEFGEGKDEAVSRLDRLESTIQAQRVTVDVAQRELDALLVSRRQLLGRRQSVQGRLDEIADLEDRFALLRKHYDVDLRRLAAIQETGSLFAHVERVACPVCGAPPTAQHTHQEFDPNIDGIVQAAEAEIRKIERLKTELSDTVEELGAEAAVREQELVESAVDYERVNTEIRETVSPEVREAMTVFTAQVEERSKVQQVVGLYAKIARLEERKKMLTQDDSGRQGRGTVTVDLPESVAFSFSENVSSILHSWNFPGDCDVHFDKTTNDFVIDGKPRGSRGKGLRAITHAAITLALLEYCQDQRLPHPGFIVLDSPLLAYFEPEGDEDIALQGTDLKERFYEYLLQRHVTDSQIIIVENLHPPDEYKDRLSMTVFTGNPDKGRFGFF
ncbi:MAG: hypothetical protein OYK82_12915 [Gammaproteobacteria bacterium]|nr:hypothetical protein [Gammaproteobacteria bacterium]